MKLVLAIAGLALLLAPPVARADDKPDDPAWTLLGFTLHGQATVTDQATLPFHDPYAGPNSLTPKIGRETFDATFALGADLWRGAEVWIEPEVDQGFGLDNTLGVAGFPSAEAYKVGASAPYIRLQRIFLRQTFDLGGGEETVDGDLGQMTGHRTANRIVVTVGKFGVPDIFGANQYAHDPRNDFLNWTVIDTGTFDYAADAWGYTAGAAVEWRQGRWTTRAGLFDLSVVPNSEHLDWTFGQFQMIGELEERHSIAGQPGKIALTGFLSRGRMGTYADAIALSHDNGLPPSTALVRDYRGRAGLSLNLEQALTSDIGLFARAGFANGGTEVYEFTDVDRTGALGLSLAGKAWGRPRDSIGLAGVINAISSIHQAYLADGGLGILIGDGKLPHPTTEKIVETYYSLGLAAWLSLTFDAQLAVDPAYNPDRGPAPILAARLHAHF
jgi:high affinity Mn2+ porin